MLGRALLGRIFRGEVTDDLSCLFPPSINCFTRHRKDSSIFAGLRQPPLVLCSCDNAQQTFSSNYFYDMSCKMWGIDKVMVCNMQSFDWLKLMSGPHVIIMTVENVSAGFVVTFVKYLIRRTYAHVIIFYDTFEKSVTRVFEGSGMIVCSFVSHKDLTLFHYEYDLYYRCASTQRRHHAERLYTFLLSHHMMTILNVDCLRHIQQFLPCYIVSGAEESASFWSPK